MESAKTMHSLTLTLREGGLDGRCHFQNGGRNINNLQCSNLVAENANKLQGLVKSRSGGGDRIMIKRLNIQRISNHNLELTVKILRW